MKRRPKVGDAAELEFVVKRQHAIDFSDAQMPAVLSTPWLIWFLEHTARSALLPLLESTESTVGIHVDVEHLAPTPLGHRVNCEARVINIDNHAISFQLAARDELERIARGIHKLQVIQCDRFRSRVERKERP